MLAANYSEHDSDLASHKKPVAPESLCAVLQDLVRVHGPEAVLEAARTALVRDIDDIQTVTQDDRLTKEEKVEKKARISRLERVARLAERGAELAMRL